MGQDHFRSLNLMELAAQQRRMIHKELGNFYHGENSSWLIETKIKIDQNCLNNAMQYRKCLVSHRQLELLLETLSETMMDKHHEIAFDLSSLQRGVLPQMLTCAKRHARRSNIKIKIWAWMNMRLLLIQCSWSKVWRLGSYETLRKPHAFRL